MASMRLGGDVDGMETQTPDWVKKLSPRSYSLQCKMVSPRIVLDTVARGIPGAKSWCPVLLMRLVEGVCVFDPLLCSWQF